MGADLSSAVKSHCNVLGEIGDQNTMHKLFKENNAIILTSAFEGFPVVVKEGMSYGCVPIVTALPGNMIHLTHLSNAMLINNTNEQEVVNEGIINIEMLLSQPELLKKLSENAYRYAQKKFGKRHFVASYRTLLT
jgi:glycosyltransferase involved in cell wall biosynthesis